jgi:O-antigen/teichoic acid export membrane protein
MRIDRKKILTLALSDGLRQSLITVVGNTFATGLSALALILISRMLGPVKFGEFSVGFAIILILNKFNDGGLGSATLKFAAKFSHDKEAVNRIFSYTWQVKLALSAVVFLSGIIISPFIVDFLHFDQPIIIYLAFFLSAASTWYEQLLNMLQALHRFSEAVVVNALQSGAKLLGIALFYFFSVTQSVPIFALYMLAPLVPIFFSKKLMPKWVKIRLFNVEGGKKTQAFIAEKAQLLAMAKHSAIGFIAAGLIENIDVLFVQRYLSNYETGLLAGVSRIAMMLLLIAYSLGNVLYPRVAKYHEKTHLQKYISKAAMLAVLCIFGFLAFLPFSRFTVWLTIGPAYLPGSSILNILAAASFLTIATVPFLALFYSLKADWYFSVSGILQLAIMIAGNMLFVPHYGLIASAWTRLVTRIFLFCFTAGCALWLYYAKYVRENR